MLQLEQLFQLWRQTWLARISRLKVGYLINFFIQFSAVVLVIRVNDITCTCSLLVCLFKFTSVSANSGLIGRPRERGADTEKPGRCPTLFRMSPLVLLHVQCIALIHDISIKSLIRMTWSGGGSNSRPLALQSRVQPLDHGPPVTTCSNQSQR